VGAHKLVPHGLHLPSRQQELSSKVAASGGVVAIEKDAQGQKGGSTVLLPEEEEELLIKAGTLDLAAQQQYPPEGWDELAPYRISEAGSEQLEDCRDALAADVQPALQEYPLDGPGWDEVAPCCISEAGSAQLDFDAGAETIEEEQDGSEQELGFAEEGGEQLGEGQETEEQPDEAGEPDGEEEGQVEEEEPCFPPPAREALQPLADPENALLVSGTSGSH
jgi:hypothetical protein